MAEDPTEQLSGVLSTEPLVIDQPWKRIRRARLAIVLFALSILVVPILTGYVGFELAARRTNAQIAAINADRAANRARLQQQQTDSTKLLELARETLCALIQRTPPDPTINYYRSYYHCGPYLPPTLPGRGATPGPTPSTTVSFTPPATGSTPAPAPSPTSMPRPTPSPAPPPAPPSAPPTHVLCLFDICLF